MKKGIHPEYRDVVFWDTSSDHKFISRSTIHTKETIKWEDGKDYPVIKVEVSSASHPFFTGKKMFMDTAGRVEKFKNKYQKDVMILETAYPWTTATDDSYNNLFGSQTPISGYSFTKQGQTDMMKALVKEMK